MGSVVFKKATMSQGAKLTWAQVDEMRELKRVMPSITTAELGRMFGVHQTTAYAIIKKETYTDRVREAQRSQGVEGA